MLHRSFKPAKCKTALKLATSRLKLLKNKKQVSLKQMKRELAKLLESGQDQTARIRVEHVIREEKMMAAYDLIEIYCELIAMRLPIIESQKNCPIDLKEAITSVIFATPRCADIPELKEIQKHFTAKYGKEFISATVELRPECGVSRMLVEKLSAKAPDGQTKINVLRTIAEEHNIKWDPTSFGEKELKPPDDLLNGPNIFEKASKMNTESPNFQPPSVLAPHSHDRKHDAPLNFSDPSLKPSLGTDDFASTDTAATKTTVSAAYHSDLRPSGMGAERMDPKQSFPGDSNVFSLGRQNWNMEFKDATAAAQAAAESAERASMAARAAAELSSGGKISRQYSTESQRSYVHGSRDQGSDMYADSKFPGERFPKDSVPSTFMDRTPKSHNEHIDGTGHGNLAGAAERFYQDGRDGTKRSRSASLRSSRASFNDDTLLNSFQKPDGYDSQKISFEKEEKSSITAEMSMKKQPGESELEFASSQQEGFESEKFDYVGEETVRRQSSAVSSRSHIGTFGDDYKVSNFNYPKFGNDAGKGPFVSADQGNISRKTIQTSSYDAAAVVFDDSGSDDNDYGFNMATKYNEQESKSHFLSQGRKSPSHISADTDMGSSRGKTSISVKKSTSQSQFSTDGHSSPEFSENLVKSVDPSEPDNVVHVTFDDSDDPNSESEDEGDKSRHRTKGSSIFGEENVYNRNSELTYSENHGLTGSSPAQKRHTGSYRKPWLQSSSNDLDSMQVHLKNNRGVELNADSPQKFGFGGSLANRPAPRHGKSQVEYNEVNSEPSSYNPVDEGDHQQPPQTSRFSFVHEVTNNISRPKSPDALEGDELLNHSSSESEKELKFGTLTGGLRNKGYRLPPYIKSSSGNAISSSKNASEESSSMIEQFTASLAVSSSVKSGESTKVSNRTSSKVPVTNSDSDSDDSSEEFPPKILSSRQEPYAEKGGNEINTKLSVRAPVTYFDSDSGDEDPLKQTSTSRGRLGSGFSRRTKASASSPRTSSYYKVQVGSEASVNSDPVAERKHTRRSYGAENLSKPQLQTGSSDQWGSSKQRSSITQAASRPLPESKSSSNNESLKSSTLEQQSSLQKAVASGSTENPPNTSSSSGETSTKENAVKKGSHVHPKLPDYDTLAARLQSLRTNHQ